jgi:hypothetical protein
MYICCNHVIDCVLVCIWSPRYQADSFIICVLC